jgi:hypothetical protein
MRFHSRVDHRIWRAFVAAGGELVSTGHLLRWVWPRRQRFETWRYRTVRHRAARIAGPVRRAGTKGRPWLWRLKEPIR